MLLVVVVVVHESLTQENLVVTQAALPAKWTHTKLWEEKWVPRASLERGALNCNWATEQSFQ